MISNFNMARSTTMRTSNVKSFSLPEVLIAASTGAVLIGDQRRRKNDGSLTIR